MNAQRHSPNGIEILVVEDSATQAERLRHLLDEHGYATSVASNGREALEQLAQHRPTLIISDILMPEMDGYELCRCVRADQRLNDIPLILLTALTDPRDVLKGLECGADNFITKPFSEEYLLSRIHHILLNIELRKTQKVELGTQLAFKGERYFITSERQQILDLLLSTYETATEKNRELIAAQDQLRELNATLERKVDERTAELKAEIECRKQTEESARHLAEHDSLTDLPNRRLLVTLLDAALRSAQRSRCKVALLFLDLDRFKAINDILGHEAGDVLLKAVATRLSARLRRSDVVARLGGDEFTVLLGELSRAEQAGDVAKEILEIFHPPFQMAGQTLYVTTSIGISLYPDDSDTAEGLLRRADLAMYDAKDQGRNTYRFYNPAVDRRARERVQIENSLRQALAGGGLVMVYQPEIDLRTEKVVGLEALVRWHHPELGLLDPGRFIPLAEESDLIMALDDWVLYTVCAQARHWLDQGVPPVPIAVNLSAKRFESSDLVEVVSRCLAENRLAPEQLELELTERTLMHRIDQSVERMRELVALGIRIAVDDFGTGYSSLSYLKQLPISKLKIDQSFVRDIATDPDDRAIIQAVTALAHTLNKRVIAEGVETEEQRAFLAATGCDEAQGYLFTAPLTPDQLPEVLMH